MTPAEPSTDPVKSLAAALEKGFLPGFADRAATSLALAELVLDATESALPLARGDAARPALEALELLATGLDLFSWEGPPGWDVALARGLSPRARAEPAPSVLDGIGDAKDRAGQLLLLHARARAEAGRFLALGKRAAQGADAATLVALHASMLRLLAAAAAAAPLELPLDTAAGELPGPAEKRLVAELDARKQAGSDFADAQEEWLGRLLHDNPAAAATPSFRTYFAGLAQALRTALSLRELRDAARSGSLAFDPEALLGAAAGWQPVRWARLRSGAPAHFWSELFPPAPGAEDPLQRLSRECSLALDLIGRLWEARGLSLTAFTALASALTARCASALALWEELSAAG